MRKEQTIKKCRHYLYIVVEDPSLELPVFVTPNIEELCKFLGISREAVQTRICRDEEGQLFKIYKTSQEYYWTFVEIDYDREFFKTEIKKKIKEHKLSQRIVAESLGVSTRAVQRWISGDTFVPFDFQTDLNSFFNCDLFIPAN